MAARSGSDAYYDLVLHATALAEKRGAQVVGCGSTRLALAVGPPEEHAVAKLAYDFRGLLWNLQEAAAWLAFPSYVREAMAPCVALTPRLVLIQERVEILGPSLLESLAEDRTLNRMTAVRDNRSEITGALDKLGFEPEEGLRLDNWARRDGRVVSVDYAEKWQPLEQVWSFLLAGLEGGTVRLGSAGRERLYESWRRGRLFSAQDLPLLRLTTRAGMRLPRSFQPCPCDSRTDGRRWGACPRRCILHASAASIVARYAWADLEDVNEPQKPEEAFLAAAGIPGEYVGP